MIEIDSGLVAAMAEGSGGATVELRGVADATAAVAAMDRARAAVFGVAHPEEPESPFASYVSGVEEGPAGPRLWADLADAEAYDGVIERVVVVVVEALEAAGVTEGILTWPESPAEAVLSAGEREQLWAASRQALLVGEEPPPPAPASSRPRRAPQGPWSQAAPLPTPRSRPGAALGADGRIYVVGGESGGRRLKTIEAYDPVADRWEKVRSLNLARRGPGVAMGGDGRLYAVGGFPAVRDDRLTAEAYDFDTGRWEEVASLTTRAAHDLAAVSGPDGRVYAVAVSSGLDQPHLFEAYDPATGAWTPLEPPRGRYATAGWYPAVAVGPRIFVMGSQGMGLEIYDTTSHSWTVGAPMAGEPRRRFWAALGVDGRIYAMGGSDSWDRYFPTVEAYEPAADRWERCPPMPTARASMAVVGGPDGRIYVIGGGTPMLIADVDVLTL